ncbi:UDP-N-acetylmuramoyl-tripeptide--D-alanyl-D-alanine ligase [Psychrobacter sp. HD31]|uniref:UDP-N-acetylmuramoyl-tripeptide--D-alanyl-D- alanine ligase n=1 Tax=Psychrobacter sp. HD31 TaxID=3112003 RepID=UPI003DA54E51
MTKDTGLYTWQADNLITATQPVNGHWLDKSLPSLANINTARISTDTRTISDGDIFLALSGDNFDGHNYAQMAVEKGAVAVIVEREIKGVNAPQLLVSDSRLALGALAGFRRRQHKDVTIIAITGSSGKTTVKEMLGSIFSNIAPTLVTRGNLNNDLGVPMMLLEMSDEHKFAILELGANHIGEIAYTANIVQPDVAAILNIGTAHLGEFGGCEGICKAKSEIYQVLDNTQTAVVPELDEFADKLRAVAADHTHQIIGFGKTDVTISDVQICPLSSQFTLNVGDACQPITLPLAGEHNVTNAMAVTACAIAVGISLEQIALGLAQVKPPRGRLYSHTVGKHLLIDDTYNANPNSIKAGASVVMAQAGKKILVLGDIGELGDAAKDEHYKLGEDLANMGIEHIFALGEFAQNTVDGANNIADVQAVAYTDKSQLLADLQAFVIKNKDEACTILFKGSRFMKMETLFEALI